MSKEHYIDPETFEELVYEGKLIQMGYATSNTTNPMYAKRVIDALRSINKKDPGFKYSCTCDNETTIWLFGYTIREVYEEADNKCKEIVKENRIDRNESLKNMEGAREGYYTACSCPFDI